MLSKGPRKGHMLLAQSWLPGMPTNLQMTKLSSKSDDALPKFSVSARSFEAKSARLGFGQCCSSRRPALQAQCTTSVRRSYRSIDVPVTCTFMFVGTRVITYRSVSSTVHRSTSGPKKRRCMKTWWWKAQESYLLMGRLMQVEVARSSIPHLRDLYVPR